MELRKDRLSELNTLLDQLVKNADQCVKLIPEVDELDTVRHSRKVGAALAELLDLQNSIYRLRPDLKPQHLAFPTIKREDNRKIGSIILKVNKLCSENAVSQAEGLLRTHIRESESEYETALLKTDLDRVQQLHAVTVN